MRLPDHTEQPAFGVVGDQLANPVFRHVAGLGDAGDLEQRGGRRDVGVKPAG